MQALVIVPIYIAIWILAVHIQYLMRYEPKSEKMWIYPIFTMIGLSFFTLIALLLH